jgi:hypothetical protein
MVNSILFLSFVVIVVVVDDDDDDVSFFCVNIFHIIQSLYGIYFQSYILILK